MQAYPIFPEDSMLDWQATMDLAADHERHTPPQMQPCGNSACPNRSYALFCSELCRESVEGLDPLDDAAYYDDGAGVLLGHRALSDAQAAADGDLVRRALGMPQPAAVVPTFTEAPISLTVKGLVQGQDTMLTIRGTDLASVQAQLVVAAAWFDAPAVQAQAAPAPEGETGEGWCAVHTTQMRWNPAKGSEAGWWSHKAADGSGWCKGHLKRQR